MTKIEIQKHKAEDQQNRNLDKIQGYLRLKYPMEIVEDDDGVVATIPDLPGCTSFGDTIEAAVRSLNETKELWIKGRVDAGQPVPAPSQIEDFSGKFVLRIPRSLHRSLDREARRQGVSLNQYILHLLSERHATSKIEEALGRGGPIFANLQHCYVRSKDAWLEQTKIYRFSMSEGPIQNFEPAESLLGMLDFLPKPKDFRKAIPTQTNVRRVYEGKL